MITSNEYFRKIIHLFNLIIPFGYLFFIHEKWDMVILLTVFTFLFLFVEILRNKIAWIKSLFNSLFNSMLRGHELDGKLTGATWVLIGALTSIMLFSKPVAIIALIFMSLGDTTAGLIGQNFGKHKVGNKSWEGFFSGLAVCIIVAINFPLLPLTVSLAGALTAMIMELVPIPLDDNFKIPLGAGAIMMMLTTSA